MEKFPNLVNEQVAVLRADVFTGNVLDENENLALHDQQKIYTIFDSYAKAIEYINSCLINKNNIEFVVYGKNQKLLKYVNPVKPD